MSRETQQGQKGAFRFATRVGDTLYDNTQSPLRHEYPSSSGATPPVATRPASPSPARHHVPTNPRAPPAKVAPITPSAADQKPPSVSTSNHDAARRTRPLLAASRYCSRLYMYHRQTPHAGCLQTSFASPSQSTAQHSPSSLALRRPPSRSFASPCAPPAAVFRFASTPLALQLAALSLPLPLPLQPALVDRASRRIPLPLTARASSSLTPAMKLASPPRRSCPNPKPLPCPSLPVLLLSVVLSVTLPLVYVLHPSTPALPTLRLTPSLTILTLSFGAMAASDIPLLEHNCALIRSTSSHRFIIYTESLSPHLCSVCECRKFTPVNCPCPKPGAAACNHCEKLHFLTARLREMPDMLFLDSDLLILKPAFLPRIAARANIADALAARGHANPNGTGYHGHFNSGLLFMRRLEGLDYGEMTRDMYKRKINKDQGLVSDFIFRHYDNWDTLSLKWHCRFLRRSGYDIPPSECYTLHDRKERSAILKELNFTLRKLPKLP